MYSVLKEIPGVYLGVFGLLLFVVTGVGLCVLCPEEITTKRISYDYRESSLPIDDRVESLLAQMTLTEKIGQMALVEKNSISPEDVRVYGVGGILSGAGGKPDQNTKEAWREMVISFENVSRQTRLGIPVLYGVDANHGHGNVPGATIFPHAIGLGASGDTALVEAIAEATARELVATGVNWSFSPMLDLPEDIRWGRVYESFGSDPLLTSALGAAYIHGLQGQGTSRLLATAKHYIGVGAMSWGSSSNKNFSIDQGETVPDETKLREVYLPPFKAAVEAGVGSVMAGLNSWGGTKLSAQKYLITDVLKGELGFTGFVVSDWYGVYEISRNDFRDAITAINAGIDMVMLPFEYKEFIRNVSLAVKLGFISEERIDDAVRRILTAKFKLGFFDSNEHEEQFEIIGNEEHRALARDAVAKSLVLLKNNENVLPITTDVDRIYVAGSAADNIGIQTGAWTVEWQGIDGNWLPGATSILRGLRDVASSGTEILYAQDGVFEASQPTADVGIAIVGERPYAEGWGDNPEPRLSDEDIIAIARLQEVSERIVVVLVTGRPLIVTNEIPQWDAFVVAWLPGSEGAGVADVLFGEKTFTGTLPIDWPASISQLPISTDGETSDGTKVLFSRGFGL